MEKAIVQFWNRMIRIFPLMRRKNILFGQANSKIKTFTTTKKSISYLGTYKQLWIPILIVCFFILIIHFMTKSCAKSQICSFSILLGHNYQIFLNWRRGICKVRKRSFLLIKTACKTGTCARQNYKILRSIPRIKQSKCCRNSPAGQILPNIGQNYSRKGWAKELRGAKKE